MICELFAAYPPNSCVDLYCLFLQHWIISDHLVTVVLAATMICGIGLKKSFRKYELTDYGSFCIWR